MDLLGFIQAQSGDGVGRNGALVSCWRRETRAENGHQRAAWLLLCLC